MNLYLWAVFKNGNSATYFDLNGFSAAAITNRNKIKLYFSRNNKVTIFILFTERKNIKHKVSTNDKVTTPFPIVIQEV